ncbi:MAG: ester cyclase [Actinobacteria bacterium]|nr:MAG: ester cyclase [Actinomycetota bacterium]
MSDGLPAVFSRMLDLWNGGDVDPADVYASVADDLEPTIAKFRAAFPDLRWEIDEWFVAGDRYVLRMHATGTYIGQTFRFEGVELHRVHGDRIVDSDQVWDLGALYRVI